MTDAIDMQTKKTLLRKQGCFSQLTDPELEMLAGLLTEMNVSVGQTIVSQGDRVDKVYLIVNGTADVRVFKENSIESQSVAKMQAGEAIGLNETGFYSLTGKRTATVVAETNMVLLGLSVAALHGFALAYSHVNKVMKENAQQVMGGNQT